MTEKAIPFEPLEGWILCESQDRETSPGGLVIPQGTEKSFRKLKVVRVGRGEQMDCGRRREVVVYEGQWYWFAFPDYSRVHSVTIDGVKYEVVQSKFVAGRAIDGNA